MRFSLFIFSLVFFSQPIAEENRIEYKIKAGYLYNFTKFITWPENDLNTFNLCILGGDPFGSIINPIEKRAVKDRPIRLYRIQATNEADHCHIAYLSRSSSAEISLPGILTIGSLSPSLAGDELKQAAQAGSMISFFQREGKVKLYINLESLRNSGLEVSAKLLEVAEIFEGKSND
jgi:hypothetical protein